MGRRWIEPQTAPPLDLRLVPAAGAVWLGCLIGLRAASAAWWTAAACGALIVLMALHVLRRPAFRQRRPVAARLAGWAAVLVCLAGASAMSAMRVRVASADPLVVAGGSGDWAVVTLIVTGDPQPLRSGFPTGPDDEGGTAERWRVPARATTAQFHGTAWPTDAAVAVFGTGVSWGRLAVGEQFTAAGTVQPDGFAALPGVLVRARLGPTAVRGPPWWQTFPAKVRGQLTASAAALPPDPAALLPALVLGDTRRIGDALAADARTTGLTHLVAVSGSHIAIICGAVVFMLRRAGPRVAAVGAAVTLAGLVVLVGPQPSVLRSAVMGGIGLAAVLAGRGRTALPALAAAVIVLLLADPALAVAAGFALSVQATAGLILLAPGWSAALQRRGVPRGWADLLVLPVAAQVTTMPVIAAISGTVSLAAVPANIVAAPAVIPALVIGMCCALLGPQWPAAGRLLARMDGPFLSWVSGTAHRFARWPHAAVPWPASTAGVLALAALTAAGLLALRHHRVRALVVAALSGAALVLIPAQMVRLGWPPAGWLLTGCEVGQGDAMVLSTGEPGIAVVVDTGPDPTLVDACLDRLGIGTIGLLVLTHLHADHVGGLAGAIAGRTVGAIGVGPDREPAPAWRKVLATAAGRGIPVVSLTPGTRWASAGLSLEVLGPAREYHGTDSDPNNDSVVLMATIAGVRMLMTGDIEEPAQQALLDARLDLRAQVLKEPHHGSTKVLPAFLAAVSPEVAVIGVGQGNDYGQPSPETLRRLATAGVGTILRTDIDGDVVVSVTRNALTTVVRGAELRRRHAVPP